MRRKFPGSRANYRVTGGVVIVGGADWPPPLSFEVEYMTGTQSTPTRGPCDAARRKAPRLVLGLGASPLADAVASLARLRAATPPPA